MFTIFPHFPASFRSKIKFFIIILLVFFSFFPSIESSAFLSSPQRPFSSSTTISPTILSASSTTIPTSSVFDQLQIDYSSFFGGSGLDGASSTAVDKFGNLYIAGYTNSTNFPIKNAFQSTFGGGRFDAFVAKFNATGSLLFSTYLGGNRSDQANGIAVDGFGNCYIIGNTLSVNFPTKNAFNDTMNSPDMFIAKFNTTGGLVFSTYFGGSGLNFGNAIAVDNSGNVFITGSTEFFLSSFGIPSDFPIKNAYNGTYGGFNDAFVSKFNSSGSLIFSTFLGGSKDDAGLGIAVDGSDNVYVTGYTDSANFPSNVSYNDTAGQMHYFLTKFSSSGSLIYSKVLRIYGDDWGDAISVDQSNNVLITGSAIGSRVLGFLAKFNSKGDLIFSISLPYEGTSLSTDKIGFTYVSGGTDILKYDSNGNLIFDVNLGQTYGYPVYLASYSTSYLYITGLTLSTFSAHKAYQSIYGGGSYDAFLTKLNVEQLSIPSVLENHPIYIMFILFISLIICLVVFLMYSNLKDYAKAKKKNSKSYTSFPSFVKTKYKNKFRNKKKSNSISEEVFVLLDEIEKENESDL